MVDLITFLDNNGNLDVYTGVNIHGFYCYLEIIGDPTTLTTSGHLSHYFGVSSSDNNDTENIQIFISDLCMRQNIICG